MGRGTGGANPATMDPMEDVPEASPAVLLEPPLEEQLAHNTLWAEVQKLYGHGNEVWCMAADRWGTMLATACKVGGGGKRQGLGFWGLGVQGFRGLGV